MHFYIVGTPSSNIILNYIKSNIIKDGEFSVLSSRKINLSSELPLNANYIICTNPYKSSLDSERLLSTLILSKNPKLIHILSTAFYSESGDYYQYLKSLQLSLYCRLPCVIHNIGFTTLDFIYNDIQSVLYFKYIDSDFNEKFGYIHLSSYKYVVFLFCKKTFWGGFVKGKYLNIIFKVLEKLIFKFFGINLPSACYFGINK